MSLFSVAELESLHGEQLFDKVGLLERPVRVKTSTGTTETYQTIYPEIPCRIGFSVESKAREEQVSGIESVRSEYWLTFPLGWDVHEIDRVTIDGERYNINALKDKISFQVAIRALATKLE